jgi:hypothetical protein
MPTMQMPGGAYGRPTYGLPTIRAVNVYIEATKEGPTQAARIPRPGLTRAFTLTHAGSGPVLRMYQNPGLFRGDLFSVAGSTFWRNDTYVSDIPYGLQPRMAAANNQLALVVGGALYVYQNGALTLVPYFDDGSSRLPPFSSVAVLYNIFVYTVAGSTEFFWSSVGDATTINAANFSNAQTSPDPISEVAVLAEELYFFKQAHATEIWNFTGALTAPFAESQGRTYIRGTPSQGSVVLLDNALFWIGDNYTVYRTDSTPQRVSTSYIEDLIRQASDSIDRITAFNVAVEGHDFYVLNFPSLNKSFAYDCQTQEWAQWGSQQPFQTEPGLLMAGCSTGQGATLYAGSATEGHVWLWDTSAESDDGTAIEKTVTATFWTTAGKLRLNSIGLACVRGVGNSSATDPQVRMRLSKDTRTFGPWLDRSLGASGEYGRKAVWRALGLVSQPGLIAEFSTTEPVTFVPEGVSMNESRY